MSGAGAPRHDPIPIGEVSKPPFCRLPDPHTLFADARRTRFARLAAGTQARPLSVVPRRPRRGSACAAGRPRRARPAAARGARAGARIRHAAARPQPLHRRRRPSTRRSTACSPAPQTIDMPDTARAALGRAAGADPAARDAMVRAVLADAIPVETLADHVFVAAALQVHFARLAARLDASRAGPGRRRRLSGLRRRAGRLGGRRLAAARTARASASARCAPRCGTVVRIKCVLCGSTKGIAYQEVDGGAAAR